jgi:hypothetical protein
MRDEWEFFADEDVYAHDLYEPQPSYEASAPFGHGFLTDVFPGGRQALEAAFDADLSAAPEILVWTPITAPYVRWNPGIRISIGYARGGAAKRLISASLTADLRNDQDGGGDFTVGNALSRFWPGIRENTPIRARLDIGSGPSCRFYGFATEWSPRRAPGGDRFVRLLANGPLRRIAKGKSKPFSALRKSMERAFPRAYWPLEGGGGATVGASARSGVPDMTVTSGTVSFGTGDDSLPSSLPLAQFSRDGAGGQLTGVIPALYGTSVFGTVLHRIEFVAKMPPIATGGGNYISIMDWNVRGSIERWNLTAKPAGEGGVVLQYTSSGGSGSYTSSVGIDDNEWHHVRIDATQDFGNIAFTVKVDGTTVITNSLAGTNGVVTTVVVNYDDDADRAVPTLGHLAVWDRTNTTEDTLTAFRGHTGETVAERLARLSNEADVSFEIIGDADDVLGPQRPGAYLDLVYDAIDVDGGLLVDGLSPNLQYYTRQRAYSRPASLTLDAAAGDFPGPIEGEHTDRDRVNTYTATDPYTAADRTFEQEEGDLGTATVGEYETGGDHRVNNPDQLDQIAAWKVGRGTMPGLRWPALAVEFAKPVTAAKAQQWLETLPLDRVDALGIDTGHMPDRSLSLRGWIEHWNSKQWDVTLNVEPYDGDAVTVVADETGDTGEFIGWLEVDTVTTVATLAAGGTSVTVEVGTGATLTHPAVSTYADDLDGLYINLDGLKVGVTAISAPSGTQQTLTLVGADVLRAVPAGATLTAWDPAVIGL